MRTSRRSLAGWSSRSWTAALAWRKYCNSKTKDASSLSRLRLIVGAAAICAPYFGKSATRIQYTNTGTGRRGTGVYRAYRSNGTTTVGICTVRNSVLSLTTFLYISLEKTRLPVLSDPR